MKTATSHKGLLRSARLASRVSIGLLVVLGLLVVIAPAIRRVLASRHLDFDAARWQQADWRTDPARLRMYGDLRDRYQLVGMEREDVLALLGTPDRRDEADDTATYMLAHGRLLGAFQIGHKQLTLQFGGGTVVAAYVWD